MKKVNLKNLAIAGITTGIIISSTINAAGADTSKDTQTQDQQESDGGNLGYHLYTEEELELELNDEGLKTFNSLSPEGKKLALLVASQRCNNMNECKGLNACQTEHNSCAGKGSCKAKGKCAFSDKNLAVKIVAEKMAQKRNNVNHK